MRADGVFSSGAGLFRLAALGALLFTPLFPASAGARSEGSPLTAVEAEEEPAATPPDAARVAPASAAFGAGAPAKVKAEDGAGMPAAKSEAAEKPLAPANTAEIPRAQARIPRVDSGRADQAPANTEEILRAQAPARAETPPVAPKTRPTDDDIAPRPEAENPAYDGLGNLREFIAEGEVDSPIGVEVREARRRLDSGEEAQGLLIVKVASGSPAKEAGLRPYRRAAHDVLTGVAILGAMFFPPAILAVPIVDSMRFGESYDMIVGVDGERVSNFIDLDARLRTAAPGEVVYLNMVRNGARIQLAVPIPPSTASASN